LIPLSLAASPLLVIGAFAFACMYYEKKSAPVGCAAYGIILVFGSIAGYLFGLYYGGDWAFHSGTMDCGSSGLGCALFGITIAGPVAAVIGIVTLAILLGRK
jgi:hypothetical protein